MLKEYTYTGKSYAMNETHLRVYWWKNSLLFHSQQGGKDIFFNTFLQMGNILEENEGSQTEKEERRQIRPHLSISGKGFLKSYLVKHM